MELEQLEQLIAISEAGTISAAATQLHISQSALSRSIQRLETDLGQSLFDREGKRIQLNDAGKLTLGYAREIMREVAHLHDALDDFALRQRALRVGTVAPAPLWRLTALTIERFPQIVLTSQTCTESDLVRKVLDNSIDLGISITPCGLPHVRCHNFMSERLSVSLPQQHPLAQRSSLSAHELDGETFLLYQGIGFWQTFCDTHFPHSKFIVQEDRNVFTQMLPTTPLGYFISDIPSLYIEAPNRCIVPLRDTDAGVAYYLLANDHARPEALAVFDWVAKHSTTI